MSGYLVHGATMLVHKHACLYHTAWTHTHTNMFSKTCTYRESNLGCQHGNLVRCRYAIFASAQHLSWIVFWCVCVCPRPRNPADLMYQDRHDYVCTGPRAVNRNRRCHEAHRTCGNHRCWCAKPATHCSPRHRTDGRLHLFTYINVAHIQLCLSVVRAANISPFLPYLSLRTPAQHHPFQSKHVPRTPH